MRRNPRRAQMRRANARPSSSRCSCLPITVPFNVRSICDLCGLWAEHYIILSDGTPYCNDCGEELLEIMNAEPVQQPPGVACQRLIFLCALHRPPRSLVGLSEAERYARCKALVEKPVNELTREEAEWLEGLMKDHIEKIRLKRAQLSGRVGRAGNSSCGAGLGD